MRKEPLKSYLIECVFQSQIFLLYSRRPGCANWNPEFRKIYPVRHLHAIRDQSN